MAFKVTQLSQNSQKVRRQITILRRRFTILQRRIAKVRRQIVIFHTSLRV